MYRPQIKTLDCTIRDGGLMNNWDFSPDMVREVYDGLVKAGVDYIELGYRADKAQFDVKKHGPWRFCDESMLREVTYPSDSKISVMCDVGRTDYDTILPKQDSIVSMYRIATYAKEIDKAIHLANHCKEAGYEVCVNIMAASHVLAPDLEEALHQLADTNVDVVYLVDSFGYFYSEQIHYLAEKYINILQGKEIGIHCHNNQQLAFANTIEGIIKGVNYVDGSIFGMGRAAGNCTTELLLGFLKNPKYDIRPVLALIEKYFMKLKQEWLWGYEIPYLVDGILNKHPKTALAFMKEVREGKNSQTFVGYYDEQLREDVGD